MNHSQPTRGLSKNFTNATMQRVTKADRRTTRPAWLRPFFTTSFGVAAIIVALSAGAVGTYAATNNWFNGTVGIKQAGSIITLDLTGCNTPPGVEPTEDKKNIQFKVLGDQPVDLPKLQRAMTIECEYNAATNYFLAQPVAAHMWVTRSATVTKVTDKHITFAYIEHGQDRTVTRELLDIKAVENHATIPATQLVAGNYIVLGLTTGITDFTYQEGTDAFVDLKPQDTKITALKTQYNTAEAPSAAKYSKGSHAKGMYETWNIMPLGWYKQVYERQ